jgi:prolyl-tRNA synthetase
MRLSQSGFETNKIKSLNSMYPAQDLLLQTNQLVQYGTGIYAYNNVPLKVKQNIEEIVRSVLNKNGCIEVSLPTLQPESIWQESGRWDKYVNDGTMLTIKTDKGSYGMAPTAEEAVVDFVRDRVKSYKSLPAIFYQIGEKYRNEIRTRGYLMRGKTFPMMDAYSFNTDEQNLLESYEILKKAYIEIFDRLGLDVVPVAADSGAIGGKKSEEFMLLSDVGEDTILFDKNTGLGFNSEILERENYQDYLQQEYGIEDISQIEEKRAIELGHIFQLGTKYSKSMNATYKNNKGEEELFYMGCYGIGISRTLATIYEKSITRDREGKPTGIVLPLSVAPYVVQIIPKSDNAEKIAEAKALYSVLNEHGIETILDDREQGSIGTKIKDCRILGTPYMAVLGDRVKHGDIELENVATGEKLEMSQVDLIKTLEKMETLKEKGTIKRIEDIISNNKDKEKQDEER